MAKSPDKDGEPKQISETAQVLFANNRKWAAQMKEEEPDFFSSLAKQQTPKYLWIGCSDSRVPVRLPYPSCSCAAPRLDSASPDADQPPTPRSCGTVRRPTC